MRMAEERSFIAALIALGMLGLAGCKPPASETLAERGSNAEEPTGPSQPIASPDSEGAIWSQSATPQRIIYGKPGEPPLMALACDVSADPQQLVFTRYAPADEGAQAFLALIGNGHVARIPIDATEQGGGFVWQGFADPTDERMEAFSGGRTVTATIPGAGMVRLNPSRLPGELVEQCGMRETQLKDAPEQRAP